MMGRKDKDESGSKNAPQVSAQRDQIDDNLKRVYDDMLDDAVPDRFEDLLRKLREQDEK